MDIHTMTQAAHAASIDMAAVNSKTKNRALTDIARALEQNSERILAANRSDVNRAEQEQLAAPLLKRLHFGDDKIREACKGLYNLVDLADPIGVTRRAMELDKGLELFQVTCPIGVIGVIFESRPDALVQISSLCLKSGNAVLLKGGSEAAQTNRILADIIKEAGVRCGMPAGWLGLLETRADVTELLEMDSDIDLIIPRGSNDFVRYIMNNTQIPVLGHADGICHVFIDRSADLDMALRITVDSKCQYVAVCNAAETLLVHTDIAAAFLPRAKQALESRGVELRGCRKTREIIDAIPATRNDWQTEYLDLVLSVKVVGGIDEAIAHINQYGSGHTDVIVSSDTAMGTRFMNHVDSADVFFNCSSRFADGYRYGLGAEVGISTNKIHARGPVGMEGLVIYKWRLIGNGHVVEDYSGADAKSFTHKLFDKPCPF